MAALVFSNPSIGQCWWRAPKNSFVPLQFSLYNLGNVYMKGTGFTALLSEVLVVFIDCIAWAVVMQLSMTEVLWLLLSSLSMPI